MKITEEQFESLKNEIITLSARQPTTASILQALDAILELSSAFGASNCGQVQLMPVMDHPQLKESSMSLKDLEKRKKSADALRRRLGLLLMVAGVIFACFAGVIYACSIYFG